MADRALASRALTACALAAALVLAGCASGPRSSGGGVASGRDGPGSNIPSDLDRVPDAEPRIEAIRSSGGTSKPYTVLGRGYVPITDDRPFRESGIASWYGRKFHAASTASGEPYDMYAMTAAHKTLPLPSYVEVTALDSGRTILVRVNDRGPMVSDRLIDLSRGAAEQLGIAGGVAAVRVRRTNPPASEKAQLRAGKPVAERIATPDSLIAILRTKLKALPVPANAPAAAVTAQPAPPIASGKAKPGDDRFIIEGPSAKLVPAVKPAAKPVTPKPAATTPKPAPATVSGRHVVQVATFSSEARANGAAKSVGGTVSRAGNLWRVRIGPFTSDVDAQAALGKAKAKGFRDAVVVRDR